MTVLLNGRHDITLDSFYRVAWQEEAVRIDQPAIDRMALCRRHFMALVSGDNPPFVYGVTTGYGQAAKHRLDEEGMRRQAREKPMNQAVSLGAPLPVRVGRGIVFARLANFLDGHAAVTPEFALGIADELDGRTLPPVPMDGNVCGGEMNALAHLFSRFSQTYGFQPKEANALTNGAPCAAALIADAAISARRRADIALQVSSLMIEAFKAPLDHYDPALAELWQDPFAAEAFDGLRRFLDGAAAERRPYQAPVSYRIIPQILSQMLRAVSEAASIAACSLSAVTDNPIYLAPDGAHPHGRCLSNGGFHNASATGALNALSAASADFCQLVERLTTKLLDGAISGLPHWLPTADGEEPFRYVPWALLGLAEQARHAAQHVFLPASEGAAYGQTDLASPVFLAWQRAEAAGHCLDTALAMAAVVGLHALDLTARLPPRGIVGMVERLRMAALSSGEAAVAGSRIDPAVKVFSALVYGMDGDWMGNALP
jgi:histidine ammonia-lyase